MMYRDSVACIAVRALCPIPVIGTKYRAIMYEIQQKWVLNTQPVLVAIEMIPAINPTQQTTSRQDKAITTTNHHHMNVLKDDGMDLQEIGW